MAELPLPSLEIENFRAFKHLTIEKLGRVNLIVGKNSVGKTCLLEAILLYANRLNPNIIKQLLVIRETFLRPATFQSESRVDAIPFIKRLFNNNELIIGSTTARIGQNNAKNQYTISVNYYTVSQNSPEQIRVPKIIDQAELPYTENVNLGLTVSGCEQEQRIYSLDKFITDNIHPPEKDAIPCTVVPGNGLNPEFTTAFWGGIALTSKEDNVLAALSLIIPDIQRINMVALAGNEQNRFFIAKLKRYDEPVSLTRLGDGVTRALHISLALVNSGNGILLIDEFENGLHHGVQAELWRLVFRVAHELNIQVFATTHNWDCVEAFQQAAQEDQNEEAMLIRLQRQGENIVAVSYDERELMIAAREHIEVR
ncbi:MAG: hypothetical protein EPN21_00565 [Methylococcaceae bacterium]|nr:MAG: hypothetical protein EPN21_00565 [Methylococcaceae bacterium]